MESNKKRLNPEDADQAMIEQSSTTADESNRVVKKAKRKAKKEQKKLVDDYGEEVELE